jgi:iron complex outermembrane receptor protein
MRHKETVVFLKGGNLLDREIRNSSSLLRDIAPEPGRNIEVGIRARF